jgi:lysophospholipase L1-like esterase
MAQVTRVASKAKFQDLDFPTEEDFVDLHDSVVWHDEAASHTHAISDVTSLQAELDGKLNKTDTPSTGLLLGDSTTVAYLGTTGIDTYLLSVADTEVGTTITNSAVAGHTIAQQQAVWTADANKATYDWIIIMAGLNDLAPAESAATALARYQTLIDTINAGKKSGAIVIIATMTPCKQRLIDIYGSTDGATAYTKWLAMNTAIMGGTNKITGVDMRLNSHTDAINDGTGNLAAIYNTGDHIHETNEARKIIAAVYRYTLNMRGFLRSTSPTVIVPSYWLSTNIDTYVLTGKVGIGTSTPADKLAILTTDAGINSLLLENTNAGTTGYTMMSFKGTARTYNIGTGNAGETSLGLANAFFIRDATASLVRMFINSNGNAAFGTVTVDTVHRLTVSGRTKITDSSGNPTLEVYNSSASGVAAISLYNSSNTQVVTMAWSNASNGFLPGTMWVGTRTSAPIHFLINTAAKVTIDTTGSMGINQTSPNASAILDVVSTTKGILFPRMTTTQKNNISSPAEGLVVYDTDLHKLCVRVAAAWETITSA